MDSKKKKQEDGHKSPLDPSVKIDSYMNLLPPERHIKYVQLFGIKIDTGKEVEKFAFLLGGLTTDGSFTFQIAMQIGGLNKKQCI